MKLNLIRYHLFRQNSKPSTDYKRDLQKYFTSHNLGEVPYKVAPVGSKGKEKYMATVTVEGTQFKTYPQTYNSRVSSSPSDILNLTPGQWCQQGCGSGSSRIRRSDWLSWIRIPISYKDPDAQLIN